ncbi:hypothetical protein B2J93_740 [Marssonina coronariae]|uniref:Uncharacterized protein n=1 Tax=Diplocarpon coronariae TaxID=2795749 RepID=A0A218YX56_9HELO|nr:hypothetical protein B2J93_740 [Marssonina coronariae]
MTLSFVETEKIQRSTRVAERLTSHDVTIRQKRRDTIQQSMAWTHAQDEGRIACQSRSTRLDWKDEGEKLDPGAAVDRAAASPRLGIHLRCPRGSTELHAEEPAVVTAALEVSTPNIRPLSRSRVVQPRLRGVRLVTWEAPGAYQPTSHPRLGTATSIWRRQIRPDSTPVRASTGALDEPPHAPRLWAYGFPAGAGWVGSRRSWSEAGIDGREAHGRRCPGWRGAGARERMMF